MPLIKGILSFPKVFTPEVPKAGGEAKFSCSVLIPPTDPQVAQLQAEVEQAKLNGCPSGYDGKNECFGLYEVKIPPSKDYHDPRFVGWYVFTCTAKADDRPAVVDMNRTPVIDPSKVYSGAVAYVNAGISYYPTGNGGIGGWLNGVMITEEEPPMGRLDGKPSVDQMFAGVNGAAPAPVTAPAPVAAPAPMAPPAPPPAPVAAPLQMTAKANGVTYEQYMATPGWTDEMLIEQGLAIRPSFA